MRFFMLEDVFKGRGDSKIEIMPFFMKKGDKLVAMHDACKLPCDIKISDTQYLKFNTNEIDPGCLSTITFQKSDDKKSLIACIDKHPNTKHDGVLVIDYSHFRKIESIDIQGTGQPCPFRGGHLGLNQVQQEPDGRKTCRYCGEELTMKDEKDIRDLVKVLPKNGYYYPLPYHEDKGELKNPIYVVSCFKYDGPFPMEPIKLFDPRDNSEVIFKVGVRLYQFKAGETLLFLCDDFSRGHHRIVKITFSGRRFSNTIIADKSDNPIINNIGYVAAALPPRYMCDINCQHLTGMKNKGKVCPECGMTVMKYPPTHFMKWGYGYFTKKKHK